MMGGLVVGGVLALAVLLAWARLWGLRRDGRWWGLLALQPLAAGLLWLALFPPAVRLPAGVLIVAGRGAPAGGVHDVRLPEAGADTGAAGGEAMPDLATALRRRGAAVVRLVGDGLEPRDVDAFAGRFAGVGLDFAPLPLPRGVVRLGVSGPVSLGGAVTVYGAVKGLEGGRVLLLDPAGREVDGQQLVEQQLVERALDAGDDFVLRAPVRALGAADWQLRLIDGEGALVEQLVVPVVARAAAPVRMWVRAGAPGAALKYVQRWAVDAGLDFGSEVALGAGVRAGDRLALSAAGLRRVDVLVLDERSWAGLSGGERGAVLAAVRGGMGLILRVTGPVSATVRRDWGGLGLLPGDTVREVRLADGAKVQALRLAGGGAVPLLRGADGEAVAAWRALGRGRVALWPVVDGFALVLAGEGAVFDRLWSEMTAAVARPVAATPVLPQWGFVGERAVICGVGEGALMAAPDGRTVALLADAAAGGCAGYWPGMAGWHELRVGEAVSGWLRVLPDAALPGVRAAARRDAALLRVGPGMAGDGVREGPGRAWPWWLGFVAAAGLLWWLERRRQGGLS